LPATLIPFPPGVADTMQSVMRLVVTEGTGKRARLPGAPVAGKTGTAEFGSGNPLPTHAWFIGFRGDLAVAVVVEGGGFGGDVAAPIAAEVLRRLS
jgi:cell division protein FtsI/penicillin-binding protein 2